MATKKTSSVFNKLLYFVNVLFVIALLFAYVLPLISPKHFPIFGVFSLFVPFLIVSNVVFCIYWIIRLKKHLILSLVTLLLGWLFSTPFYKLSSKKIITEKDVKVMSYNVHMFNVFKHIQEDSIDTKIIDFIHNKNPDILALQEYHDTENRQLHYPYSYFVPKSKKQHFGLALFSNYPIINKGSLDFENSANNAIFIDVVDNQDTIRVYNLHLQSLKLNPKKDNFGEQDSEKLIQRMAKGFLQQATQTEQFLAHEQQFTGKKVICGDFNNTAYSWVYHQMTKGKKDAFLEAGSGFGKSFNYFFPMRIDFIITDNQTTINHYKIYDVDYSDHYPIMARLNW